MFAVACVEAITGEDRGADLRGTYSDARGALRTLEEQGGIEAVASRAGDPIHPLCASVGDVGLIEMDGRESLAVCVGDMWIAPAPQGLCAMPFSTASKAWRVAHA